MEFLASLYVEAAFISGIGLTLEAGLTSQRRATSDVLKEVVARSPRTYMLVDHSKFGRTRLLHIAWSWHAADVIVDSGAGTGANGGLCRTQGLDLGRGAGAVRA